MVINDRYHIAGGRELLARVNLHDFRGMVVAEFDLVWSAVAAAIRSPSLLTPVAIMAGFLRLLLLAIVVVVLGTAISVVVSTRAVLRWGQLLIRKAR
jgi:hypothetical protein